MKWVFNTNFYFSDQETDLKIRVWIELKIIWILWKREMGKQNVSTYNTNLLNQITHPFIQNIILSYFCRSHKCNEWLKFSPDNPN